MNSLYRELDESQQKMLRGPGDETICGYPIRDLVIFADACRVAGVGPKELKDFVGNVEATCDAVVKAMDEHLARCLEKYLKPTAIYENEEAEEDVLIEALEKNTEEIEKRRTIVTLSIENIYKEKSKHWKRSSRHFVTE